MCWQSYGEKYKQEVTICNTYNMIQQKSKPTNFLHIVDWLLKRRKKKIWSKEFICSLTKEVVWREMNVSLWVGLLDTGLWWYTADVSLETAKEYCEWYTTLHEGDDHGVILHGDKRMTQCCSATIDIDTNTESIRALIDAMIAVERVSIIICV